MIIVSIAIMLTMLAIPINNPVIVNMITIIMKMLVIMIAIMIIM